MKKLHLESKYLILSSCCLSVLTYQGARDIMSVLLPSIQNDFSLSYTQLGAIAGAFDWGFASSLLIGGYLADKYGRRRMISIGLVWLAVNSFLVTLAATYQQVVLFRFLSAFGFATYFGAANSLIAEIFEPSERGKAIGMHYSGGAVGRLLMPLIAAFVVGTMGWREAFYVLILAAILALIFFFFTTNSRQGTVANEGPINFADFREMVWKNKGLWQVMLLYSISVLTGTSVVFIPITLVRTWGTSITEAALYLSIVPLVMIFAAPLMGTLSDRFGWKPVIMISMASNAIFLYLFPIVPPGIFLILVLVGIGIVSRIITVILAISMDVMVPRLRSTSLGFINTAGALALTLLPIVGGYIADISSFRYTFIFMAIVSLLGVGATGIVRVHTKVERSLTEAVPQSSYRDVR